MALHSPEYAELASLAQQFNILFEALRSKQNDRYREIQDEFPRHWTEISEALKRDAYPPSRGYLAQMLDFSTREVVAHKPGIKRALKAELYSIAGKMWKNMVLGLYAGDMEEPGFWPEGAISQFWPHLNPRHSPKIEYVEKLVRTAATNLGKQKVNRSDNWGEPQRRYFVPYISPVMIPDDAMASPYEGRRPPDWLSRVNMLTDYHNEALRAEIQLMSQLYNIYDKRERWQILQQYVIQMLQLMERKYEEHKHQNSTINNANATPRTGPIHEPGSEPDRRSGIQSPMASPSPISPHIYTDFVVPDVAVDGLSLRPKKEGSGLCSDNESSRTVTPRLMGLHMHPTGSNDRGAGYAGSQSGWRQIDPQQEQSERPVSSPATLGDDEARIVANLKSQLHWILGIEGRASVASSISQEDFESLVQSPATMGSDDVRRLEDYELQVDEILGLDGRGSVAASSDDLNNSESGKSIQQEWSDDDEDSGTTRIDLFPAQRNKGDGGIRAMRPNERSTFAGGINFQQTRSAPTPSQNVVPPPTNGKTREYATNHRGAAEESFLEIFTPSESTRTQSLSASSQATHLTPPRVRSAWRELPDVQGAKWTRMAMNDDYILPYQNPHMESRPRTRTRK